jgi:hypothetical protein
MGFAGLVQDEAFVLMPQLVATTMAGVVETAASFIASAPSPPPRA